jgi:hypothetical protein
VIGIVTTLRARRYGVRYPAGTKEFLLLQIVQAGSGKTQPLVKLKGLFFRAIAAGT